MRRGPSGQLPTAAHSPALLDGASGSPLPGRVRPLDNCPCSASGIAPRRAETRSARLGWRPLDGRNESPARRAGDALKHQAGTSPRHRRSCAMGRPVTRTRVASVWQKLASAIAILAVAMFVAHGVAAKGTLPHAHDHSVAHAETSLIAASTPAEPGGSHEYSSAVGHKHGTAKDGTAPCCGEACLLALMPEVDTHPNEPWGVRSKSLFVFSSLAGHDPEGLRRPPRLPHRI